MNEYLLKQSYNRDEFLGFVRWFLPDFSEEHAIITPEHDIFEDIQILGNGLKGELTIIEIKTRKVKNNERVSITKEAFRIMFKRGINQAIICFYAGGKSWRMSLLTTNTTFKDGKIIREGSNPHRYSYYLGEKAKTKTPHKFLIGKGPIQSLDDLKSRFSIEVVNKEFYTEISNLFFKLVGGKVGKVSYPGIIEIQGLKKGGQEVKEFAVRLIGRIIFCWFLREKKSKNNKSLIPEEILSTEAVEKNTANYYHDILEPLFFETLNKRHSTREKRFETTPFRDVPYLNGGLFSQVNGSSGDYYEYSKTTETGAYGVLTIENSWFKSLFELLSRYNFTVDENTSYDIDLSIDPEMLGRIFENLLAEINPETDETARNSTGSFYTPREIVDYMVDSSLLEYLKEHTNIADDVLLAIINYNKDFDESYLASAKDSDDIIDALAKLKILDPACGSGAFPIGVLQKTFYILQQIDADGKRWYKKQIENIPSEDLRRDLENKFNEGNYDYIRKLGIIRQSIFGVDIQPIATEIAKLRCFLTLVIEQEVNDETINRGIHPLPNLDFKFVTANSLVPLPKESFPLLEDSAHIDKLKEIAKAIFSANTEERNALWGEFKGVQLDMFTKALDVYKSRDNISSRYSMLLDWKPYDNKPTNWFDPEWMFGVDNFDIVIANPPYIDSEKMTKIMKEEREFYKNIYSVAKGNWDLYVVFFQMGFDILANKGVLCYVSPNQWLTVKYGSALRELTQPHIIHLCDMRNVADFKNAEVNTFITILEKNTSHDEVNFVRFGTNHEATYSSFDRLLLRQHIDNYGVILSENFTTIQKIFNNRTKISDYFHVYNTFTTNEYYLLTPNIHNQNNPNDDALKLVNTGTLGAPFHTEWGIRELKHDGTKILYPVVNKKDFIRVFPRREPQQFSPKIIVSQSSGIKIFIDEKGEFLADKVLITIVPKDKNATALLKTIGLILDSKLMRWLYEQLYSTGGMMGTTINDQNIKNIPLPPISQLLDFKEKYQNVNVENYERIKNKIDEAVFRMYNVRI